MSARLFLSVVLLLLAPTLAVSAEPNPNFLPNPGFEAAGKSEGLPESWHVRQDRELASVSLDSRVKQGSTFSQG